MIEWLIEGGLGPALVAWPVNWGVGAFATGAKRWFQRLRRTDGLSRLLRQATGSSIVLTDAEFDAVRRLLEDEQTWRAIGRGEDVDLQSRIASCLPPSADRTVEDSRTAAGVVVRGVLESAVADLEPGIFQQIVLARLQRMETARASALDEAMLWLHADLTARLAERGEIEAQVLGRVAGQLDQMLDRLPPGPAGRTEIAVYLAALATWLNSDPWPRDRRFGGPVLTPTAIERKLRILDVGGGGEKDLDADGVARRCRRLVVLGGPGSGKTWLARRSVRLCAEAALEGLSAGRSLDEIELPLYTTCSRLTEMAGDIRKAVVSSALDQIGDLGGSRVTASLQLFLAERNAPTLLVIDALDEAQGAEERLRQADTLPWRILLTSRPSSWNEQLSIGDTGGSGLVGELQPLRYPQDVEPFIGMWFADRPMQGKKLAVQIAGHVDLQQAVTVPLILAFYCIVGGKEPESFPEFRHQLYAMVLKRILTGRWRADAQPDVDACLTTLRAWAWSAAGKDPVVGTGVWADDFPAFPARLDPVSQAALGHIAIPLGPPDLDSGKTIRRFIHRSIREHLVAEYVAGLPADEAAGELLDHIWYDPDWEHAAPAALAMHPEHDEVLRELGRRVTLAGDFAASTAAIERLWEGGGFCDWEFLEFLAKVALESSETSWSAEAVKMIGWARARLAWAGRVTNLAPAASWAASNLEVRRALLAILPRADGMTDGGNAAVLVDVLARLGPTAGDKRRARKALLQLFGNVAEWYFAGVIWAINRLDPTPEDKRRARRSVLRELRREHYPEITAELAEALSELDPVPADRHQALEALQKALGLGYQLRGGLERDEQDEQDEIAYWAQAIARLVESPAERVSILAKPPRGPAEWTRAVVAGLKPTAAERAAALSVVLEQLAVETNVREPSRLTDLVESLAVMADERGRAREALLAKVASRCSNREAARLASVTARLNPTDEERARLRAALLPRLTRNPGSQAAAGLAGVLTQLDPTAEDRKRLRMVLLQRLTQKPGSWVTDDLAETLAGLDPTADERARVRRALLRRLTESPDSCPALSLADALAHLDPTDEEKACVRHAVLEQLARAKHSSMMVALADVMARFDATAEDHRKVRAVFIDWLARERLVRRTAHGGYQFNITMAQTVAQLELTVEEKARVRMSLLSRLATETEMWEVINLADAIARFEPTAEDRRQARKALLGLDAWESSVGAVSLVAALAELAVTAEDRRELCSALLEQLAQATSDGLVIKLAHAVARFDPAPKDRREVRHALLGRLAQETEDWQAEQLANALARLNPTTEDLAGWHAWGAPPTTDLLAAVRRNSTTSAWVAVSSSAHAGDPNFDDD